MSMRLTVGGRTRSQLTVAYLFLAVMVSTNLPTPLYSLYAPRLSLSSLEITTIYAGYALVVLATLLLLGRVFDHVGRRPVLLLSIASATDRAGLSGLQS